MEGQLETYLAWQEEDSQAQEAWILDLAAPLPAATRPWKSKLISQGLHFRVCDTRGQASPGGQGCGLPPITPHPVPFLERHYSSVWALLPPEPRRGLRTLINALPRQLRPVGQSRHTSDVHPPLCDLSGSFSRDAVGI